MPADEVTIDNLPRQDRPSRTLTRHSSRGPRPRAEVADLTDSGLQGNEIRLVESTKDYTPAVKVADEARCEPRAPAEGSPVGPTAEARDLLCCRLAAAARMLALIVGLWLARSLIFAERDPCIVLLYAWTLVALAIVHAWLTNDRDLTIRQLRALELALFGGVVALLATGQYRLMFQRFRQEDAALVLAAVRSGVWGTVVVMLTYGLFIPNGWRRAAPVVASMAVMPAAVGWLVIAQNPGLPAVVGSVAGLDQASENGLILLIGAVLSAIGPPMVGALSTRVYEAHHMGPYQLLERIGSGGMGEVYLAEHQLLKRPCAIKLIRPGSAADPRALARFEREVRTTAQLSHWNTVEIYDYGRTEDGTFFYVMEYLPGLSLADLVERHGPLPPERVIHLLRQACQALAEAHGLNLIHRDIKPANIFAAHRGGLDDVTKLLDFGLAKRCVDGPSPQVSRHGSITGSPLYMSPEQASGQRADHRSDIYALGAVAYFLLTAQAPFLGDNALTVMIAHARDTPPPPSTLQPDLPADLERIVVRCLAKDPDARYQDAASLELALDACASAHLWTKARAAHWWRQIAPGQGMASATDPTLVLATEARSSDGVPAVAARRTVGYSC
jgi:eukaryotic-like serine/threonine-protein kinase